MTMATPIDRVTTVASRSRVGFPRHLGAYQYLVFSGHVLCAPCLFKPNFHNEFPLRIASVSVSVSDSKCSYVLALA
ncbi:hypothetical protein M5D96_007109 [Drosophila gunungcola]|uniref:Uncharacterized protein n=1 Tax=Drosophila gunungcola TaxID=103775 RepID=A0A9P9YNG4_9MUSC|nr:hypothetical protein M5D96_007109 [Drosophila gunungcola]